MELREALSKVNTRKREKLSKIVVDVLRNALLQGNIKSGDKLSTEEIANSLEISRMPVREAMYSLEHLGVVQISDGKGSIVRGLTKEEFKQLCYARQLIEPQVAALAAVNRNKDHLVTLKNLLDESEKNLSNGDIKAFAVNNYHFHIQYATLAQNEYLKKIVDSLLLSVTLVWNSDVKDHERYVNSLKEHIEIFKAIEAGNSEQAKYCTLHHLKRNEKHILRSMKSKKEVCK